MITITSIGPTQPISSRRITANSQRDVELQSSDDHATDVPQIAARSQTHVTEEHWDTVDSRLHQEQHSQSIHDTHSTGVSQHASQDDKHGILLPNLEATDLTKQQLQHLGRQVAFLAMNDYDPLVYYPHDRGSHLHHDLGHQDPHLHQELGNLNSPKPHKDGHLRLRVQELSTAKPDSTDRLIGNTLTCIKTAQLGSIVEGSPATEGDVPDRQQYWVQRAPHECSPETVERSERDRLRDMDAFPDTSCKLDDGEEPQQLLGDDR